MACGAMGHRMGQTSIGIYEEMDASRQGGTHGRFNTKPGQSGPDRNCFAR